MIQIPSTRMVSQTPSTPRGRENAISAARHGSPERRRLPKATAGSRERHLRRTPCLAGVPATPEGHRLWILCSCTPCRLSRRSSQGAAELRRNPRRPSPAKGGEARHGHRLLRLTRKRPLRCTQSQPPTSHWTDGTSLGGGRYLNQDAISITRRGLPGRRRAPDCDVLPLETLQPPRWRCALASMYDEHI